MGSELERSQPPQIAELDAWAKKLHESGMFSDVKDAAQAFVKIAAGAEMGLTPFQAITGVHFIQNKPVVGAGLLAAMLDRPPYDYTTDWEPSIDAPTACTITVFKNGVERGKARFSLADAKRAGLTGGNWQKYPTDMMFARAISQAARRYAPGAMGTTFYVEAHGESEIAPAQRAKPADEFVTLAADILDATELDDDLPFEVAAPAPRDAESPQASGQTAANEPAAGTGGGLLDTLDDALRFVNTLEAAQLEALASLLHCARPITRRALAGELLDKYEGAWAEGILKEIG